MTMTSEIPVWVDGVEKWVTGVGRRTTCADLVRALLTAEAGSAPPTESELRSYALVERWRQVERPLDGSARIQKVWRTWGEDTAEVQFALKRLGPQTPKEVKAPRRRQRHRWRSSSSLEAVHPRKLASGAEDGAKDDVVERLMQTILVQGETIATQLRRLHEREDLIGYYEHKMHRMREDRLGSDYLLRTYLRDGEPAEAEKGSHDSGVGAELAADAPDSPQRDVSEEEAVSDLRQTLLYLERIVELNGRIAEEEEAAARLAQRVRRTAAAPPVDDDASQAVLELEISRAELQRLMAVCARQMAEIEQNERALVACERALEDKRRYARYLECELDEVEADEQRLLADGQRLLADEQRLLADERRLLADEQQRHLADEHQRRLAADQCPLLDEPRLTVTQRSGQHVPAGYTHPVYTNVSPLGGIKEVTDGDSNSDTGLSSLHSSSDEAAAGYVLDTLV